MIINSGRLSLFVFLIIFVREFQLENICSLKWADTHTYSFLYILLQGIKTQNTAFLKLYWICKKKGLFLALFTE